MQKNLSVAKSAAALAKEKPGDFLVGGMNTSSNAVKLKS